MDDFNLIPVLPEIFLCMISMGLLLVGVTRGNNATDVICWAGVMGAAITMFLSFGIGWEESIVLNGMFVMDKFAGFMKMVVLIGLMASIALSVRYLYQERMVRFEYPILMMLAATGMLFMISAHSLLILYMGLELQSLSLYVLASIRRNSQRSAEAGTKYFILGALSSGMILFGISLIYGFSGSVDYAVIAESIASFETMPQHLGLVVGMVFLLAGLAFKISAAPFHMWTPDVYEGAPTSVTAFFAIVPKVAAMAVLVRLLFEPFGGLASEWTQIIVLLSVLSITVGAFAALVQTNMKRLLAYSSIGNMGYALIGLAAASSMGISAVSIYLLIYVAMSIGVFAVLLSMRRDGIATERIEDFAGLSQTNPALAYTLAILLFSMSGIPPMAGFFGKFFVFQAAIEAELYALAIFGVLTSVVAAYYYIRVIKVMFFDEPLDAVDSDIPFSRRVLMLLAVLFVFGFTLKPNLFVESTEGIASSLFVIDGE